MSCWPTKTNWSSSKYRQPSETPIRDSPPAHLSTPTPTMKSSQKKNGSSPKVSNGSVSSNMDYDTPPWIIDQPNGGRHGTHGNGVITNLPDEVDVSSWKIGPPLLNPESHSTNSFVNTNGPSNARALLGNGSYVRAENGPVSYSAPLGNGYHVTNSNEPQLYPERHGTNSFVTTTGPSIARAPMGNGSYVRTDNGPVSYSVPLGNAYHVTNSTEPQLNSERHSGNRFVTTNGPTNARASLGNNGSYPTRTDNGSAAYSVPLGYRYPGANSNGFSQFNGNSAALNGYTNGADDNPFAENIMHELRSCPSAQQANSPSGQVISFSAPNGSSFRVLSPVDKNIGFETSLEPMSTRSGSPIPSTQQRANTHLNRREPQRKPITSVSTLNSKPKGSMSEWAFRPATPSKYDQSMTLPASARTNGIRPENGLEREIDDRPYMTIYKGPRTVGEPRRLDTATTTPSWTQAKSFNGQSPPEKQIFVVENDYKFGKEITLSRKRVESGTVLPSDYFDRIFEDAGIKGLPEVDVFGSNTLPSKISPYGLDDRRNTNSSSGYDSPVFSPSMPSPFSPLPQPVTTDSFSPNSQNGSTNPNGLISMDSHWPTMPNSSSSNGSVNPDSYLPTIPDSSRPIIPPPPPDSSTAPIKGRTVKNDTEATTPGVDALAQNSINAGKLYRDPEFPADHKSLYFSRPPSLQGNIEWKRPHEICSNPHFILDERDRFDVVQGQIGDCWLVSAIAGLTLNKKLLERVCPRNQSFDGKYAGVFSFWFWRFGKWKEVTVDDRLPTIQGRLIYVHSSKPSEFWSALVEKAYAKIMGSYEALEGGVTSEGFTDFTGGIVESLNLRDNKNHWKILLKAFQKGSFMGCGIDPTPGIREQELANGLVCGHAYTVTSIKQITIPGERQPLHLIRLRNPWGSEHEWKGPWSDRSPEWQRVPQSVQAEIHLTAKADGEFWMSFDDFRANFPSVDLCHLPPDVVDGDDQWKVIQKEGAWVPGVSSGGCGNYQDTYHTNPQYRVSLSEPDDGNQDGLCTIIVSMTQKNRRKKASDGAKNLTIGYSILKAPPGVNGLLDRSTIRHCETVGSIPSFVNSRDISHRHELPPGDYFIIPSTFKPNIEGEFLLRMYTEKSAANQELDEETSLTESLMPTQYAAIPVEKRKQDEMLESFDLVAGEDGEIDAWEMKKLVSLMFTKDFPRFEGFGIEAARSMIAMHDGDMSGKLGRHEFVILYNDLNRWKKAFKEYDADEGGAMDTRELRNVLGALGFKLSNRLFVAIAKRYGNKAGLIDVQDFILCACRLKTLIKTFQASRTGNSQSATFPMEEFITSMMYS